MTTPTERAAPYSASFGYSLALRVLQSPMYAQLHADEREECDELIRRGQAPGKGEREAFEAWAKDHLGQGYSLAHEDGMYLDKVTHWAFKAWKAGRASRAQEAPAPVRPSDGERDLAALVGRLVRRLREVSPDDKLAATATDYLQRKRYLSPLRIHANAAPPLPAAPAQPLHPRLKSTPYGPAILLDDVRDAERWRALQGAAATPAMIAAGKQALHEASLCDLDATDEEVLAVWRAMIAAQQQEKPE